jgi:hypothetical protein
VGQSRQWRGFNRRRYLGCRASGIAGARFTCETATWQGALSGHQSPVTRKPSRIRASSNGQIRFARWSSNGRRPRRTRLRDGGIDRVKLFEQTKERIAFRAHDLRGMFVTIKLALGKSEAWIRQDRPYDQRDDLPGPARRAVRSLHAGRRRRARPLPLHKPATAP